MKIQLLNTQLYTDASIDEIDARLSLELLEKRLELYCSGYCNQDAWYGCDKHCDVYW